MRARPLPADKGGQQGRPPAPGPITSPEVQPSTGASITAHKTSPMAATDRSTPARSRRRASGFRESGTSRQASSAAPRATGTLMRNTEPHQKWASSNPPTIGPRAKPTPFAPAQSPIA